MNKRALSTGVLGALVALGASGVATASSPPSTQPAGECVATNGDMEGCYRYEDMPAFFEAGVGLIRAFASDTYADPTTVEPAGGWQLIKTYSSLPGECGALDHTAYAYCGLDDTIYVGMDQIWAFYILQGDAAAVIGLAHEFGHALQMRAGILAAESSQADTIAIENQADCLAGAFTRWVDQTQEGGISQDDLDDIDYLLITIASSEDDPNRDHGTLDERANSFIAGLRDGIFACNKFFPDMPVTT